VDAGLHYKFDSGVSVGFEAQNLTNRTYKQFMQQHIGMLGHNYFTSGRSYTVTMQYSF
jgi:outer membrane receptor protein involved in Fe transport